jgi:hypothetical protein
MVEYVADLRPFDVLFGRGSGPNDHEGNVRFRTMVASRKTEYLATNHRLTKAKIAREIVNSVLSQQGRFLKKMEGNDLKKAGLPEDADVWMSVDDDTVMEKAKQALRQNSNKHKGTPGPQGTEEDQPTEQNSSAGAAVDLEPFPIQSGVQVPPTFAVDYLEPIPLVASANTAQRPSQVPLPSPNMAWSMQQQLQLQPQQFRNSLQAVPYGHPNAIAEDQEEQQGALGPHVGYNMPGTLMQPQPPPQSAMLATNDASMKRLPAQDAPLRPSLRGSLTIGDVFGRESMDMSQLMDSFRSTKISPDSGDRHKSNYAMASTETMGTIERIGGVLSGSGESMADMSIATMNSSTFSILKGDDLGSPAEEAANRRLASGGSSSLERASFGSTASHSLLGGGFALDPNNRTSFTSVGPGPTGGNERSSFASAVSKYGLSDASLSFSDLPSMRGSAVNRRLSSQPHGSLEGVEEENHAAEPLPMGMGGSGLGSSSLSMLKGMLMSTEDVLQPNAVVYEEGQPSAPTMAQPPSQQQQQQQPY